MISMQDITIIVNKQNFYLFIFIIEESITDKINKRIFTNFLPYRYL